MAPKVSPPPAGGEGDRKRARGESSPVKAKRPANGWQPAPPQRRPCAIDQGAAPAEPPAWTPTFREAAGDTAQQQSVPCPFDRYLRMYTDRPVGQQLQRIRRDYQEQRRQWDQRVREAGGVENVAPLFPCSRNHHSITEDDPAYEEKMAVLDELAGGKQVADQFDFLPDGLVYQPDFMTPEEERTLVRQLDQHGWDKDLSRRTIQFGFKFEHRIDALLRAEPIPEFVRPYLRRAVEMGFMDQEANQVIVNEYRGGSHFINPHADRHCFGEKVVTVSLLDSWTMTWLNARDKQAADVGIDLQSVLLFLLEARSLTVFGGSGRDKLNVPGSGMGSQARWKWLHSIAKCSQDFDRDLNLKQRQRRVSLTFRTVDPDLFQKRIALVDKGLIDVEQEAAKRRAKAQFGGQREQQESSQPPRARQLVQWQNSTWVRGGPSVAFVTEVFGQPAVAACRSTNAEFAIGRPMEPSDSAVHIAEFELSVDKANLALGLARANTVPDRGNASRGVLGPGSGYGLVYWAQGWLHTPTGTPALTTLSLGAGAAPPLGAHDHLRFTVDYHQSMVTVTVNNDRVVYDSRSEGVEELGVLVPFVFFDLNPDETAVRVGLRQGQRESLPEQQPVSNGRGRGGEGFEGETPPSPRRGRGRGGRGRGGH
eukprot:TRINITY_DN12993_c0_g1_i2.p2 TRINITY_DN12993_c0_g1~~TRINITY_DN12993_c0_g1_i2.p2  ORF type:complete len:676 (+),score=159.25 TRINITY_DN12993_c0_g1_i2:81-2030(+)